MPTGAAPVPASVPGDQTAAAPPTEQPPEQSALGWVGDQLSSFASGAWQGVKSIPEAFTTQPFAPPTGTEAKPPGDFAGATGYGITSSVPMLAGGAGGALLGTAIGGPPGGIAGGALGMFAGTVVQELRPGYVAAVNSGLDHDAAVNQAITQALAQGTFSGLTAPLFAWAPFKGLVGKLLFTSMATGPAVGAAGRVVVPAVTGQPMPSAEELAKGVGQDVITGFTLGGVHEAGRAIVGHGAPAAKPGTTVRGRLPVLPESTEPPPGGAPGAEPPPAPGAGTEPPAPSPAPEAPATDLQPRPGEPVPGTPTPTTPTAVADTGAEGAVAKTEPPSPTPPTDGRTPTDVVDHPTPPVPAAPAPEPVPGVVETPAGRGGVPVSEAGTQEAGAGGGPAPAAPAGADTGAAPGVGETRQAGGGLTPPAQEHPALTALKQVADPISAKDLIRQNLDLPDAAAAAMVAPDGRIFMFRPGYHDYATSHADFAVQHPDHPFIELSSFGGKEIGASKPSPGAPTDAQMRTINALRQLTQREGGNLTTSFQQTPSPAAPSVVASSASPVERATAKDQAAVGAPGVEAAAPAREAASAPGVTPPGLRPEDQVRVGQLDRQITRLQEDIAKAPAGPARTTLEGQLERLQASRAEITTGTAAKPEAQPALDKLNKQIAPLEARVEKLVAKENLTKAEQRELGNKQDQLAKLRVQRDQLVGASDAEGLASRRWRPRNLKPYEPPPEPTLTRDFHHYQFQNGTSVYSKAFADAGHDPRLATSYPVAKQLKILTEQTQRQFGFKSVKFSPDHPGGKVAIDELLNLYRGIHDMMAAHNLPLDYASMGGKLHLQLEPLRSGPKAYYGQYSYGPLGRTIHIAGGSNVFGHEWIHAFDHDLIERMQLDPQRTNLLSRFTRDKGLDPKDGTKAAFAKLLNTMFYDEGDLAHQRMQLQQLAGEVRKDGSPTEMARMAQENLKVIESGKAMKMQIKSSEYRKMAKEFSPNNPYWSDEEELLARAGESYLARGMEQNGVNPRGVVMPDEAYARGLDKRLKMTFPKNDELMAIHAAFKDVFDAARAEGIWGSAAAAKSNDYGMVDPNGFMRTARLAGDTPTLRKKAIEFMQVGNNLKRVQKSMKETTPFDRSRPIAERKWSKRASLWAGHVFNSKLAAMDAIIKANPESARPYLQQIRDAFGSQHGSGRATGEGMEQESRAQATTWQNGLAAILQKHGLLEKMTDLQDRMIVWGLTTGEDNYRGTPMPDNVKSVIQEARLLHNQVFDTAERAKLDIEYVGQQYPRIYDTSKINANQSNKDAFTADATKVYKVDFNNQVGVPGDKPDVLLKKYRQLSPGDKSDIDTKNPGVNAGMKELGKNLRRQRAIEKQLAAGPDPALSAELAQLQAEARQLAEDHHDAIGDHISSEAAIDWQLRTSKGYPGDFEKIGPSGRFLQHRTLPPETDRLMENWMVRDVRTVLPQYYEQVARKVAYAKRLGPKGEILESLLDNAARHGLMLNDGPTMRGLVQQITGYGEDGNATHNVIGPLANSVNAYGAALLMPRSMWTSLHEFAVSGLATGDLRVSLRSLANIMGDIIGTGAAHDRREVADLVGVTQSKLAESLMTARIGSDYHDSPRIAWLMQKYYKMIGLTGLTNAIRRANFGALNWHLRNQSRNLLSAEQGAYWDLRRDRARRLFNEMGIPPAEHLAFAAEMLTHDGVPEFNYLTDPNNAGFARLYGRAMRQLSDWSSQNPYKGDRPALAETPMGRFVWQLQHFNYAFQRNVLDPMVHNMGTDFAFMRDRALAQGAGYLSSRLHGIGGLANAGVGFAGAAGLLVASSLVTTMLREMLFNGDKLDEHKKKGDLGDWFTDLAIQRAGLSGSLDPLVQMVNNMRYNADANSLIAGASPTFIAKNLTDVIRGVQSAFDPEAPETNTRAHDATKALYNLVGIPAMAMMSMGIAGAGVPLVTPGASFAFQKLSSQQSAEHAADVTGPKGAKLPKGGEEDMNMTPDLSSTADEGMNMTPDLLAEPKPGEKTGGTVGASVPWGFLDDFIAPAAPLVKSGLGIVPGWMKAGAVGAAGLAGASSFMSRMEPYRNAPAPETPRSR